MKPSKSISSQLNLQDKYATEVGQNSYHQALPKGQIPQMMII